MSQRHTQILQILAVNQNASVSELSQMCRVSEVTIRSDLNILAKTGKIERTHGGARLIEERVRQEYNYKTRKSIHSDKKLKIGRLAASLVNRTETVLLDSSSTAVSMAQALNRRETPGELTIITTGIWTAVELMSSPDINVLLTGGYVRHISGSIAGVPAEKMLKNLNIHKSFLGAWGLSVSGGLTDNHLLEVELKRHIVQRTEEIYVIVDGSKFNRNGLASYATLEKIKTIITDTSAPPAAVAEIRTAGVDVLIAD